MAYCKTFISIIQHMNGTEEMAKAIYPIVMNAVYHHIDGEYQQLMKQYDELPLSTVSHSLSQTLLNDYKTRLEGELEAIRTQQEQIKSHIDVIQPHLLNTRFVTDFAAYFQTIDHLAYALSDAPPAIKALDVALYREVLYKLPPKDQEQQLKNLSFITLKTLIDGMIHSYDATENGPLK